MKHAKIKEKLVFAGINLTESAMQKMLEFSQKDNRSFSGECRHAIETWINNRKAA